MRNYGLQKNLVGQTSVKISNIGFGGASIGNLFRSISNEQANQAVQVNQANQADQANQANQT